jgi:hypothetical protein
LGAVGAVVEETRGKNGADAVEQLLVWLLVRGPEIRSGACAYGDVVFCELVVEVVYADLASVAKTSQRIFALSIPRVFILVGCAPSRRSSVVCFIVFVTTTATSRAVFFVAIVHPIADSMSAAV